MSTEDKIVRRYFLTEEREVTEDEYRAVLRREGFPGGSLPHSWSVGSVNGRIEHSTKPAPTP